MKNPYLKRLRIQFILVMMGICLVFLLAIFGVQYFSSRRSMQEDSREALQTALDMNDRKEGFFSPDGNGAPDGSMPPEGNNSPNGSMPPEGNSSPEGSIPPEGNDSNNDPVRADGTTETETGKRIRDDNDKINRMTILIVRVAPDGTASPERNNFFFIDDTDIQTLTDAALEKGTESGTLREQSMRFMIRSAGEEKRIAFVDISTELAELKKDIRNALLIGTGVLIVMFLLSLWLSRITLRPVARAWDDQKRFVADASHELKTPLSVILSNAEMMRKSKDQPTEKNSRRLEHIETEAVRMKELVQELLEVARGDTGERELIREDLCLSELMDECSMTWEPIIFEAGRTLVTDIAEDIHIKGNADSLRRLTEILLDNALKYSSEKGKITLRLSSGGKKEQKDTDRSRPEKGTNAKEGNERGSRGHILLSVENDGTPMNREVLEKVFDRFYRADSSREETAGYGLGLSIAEAIVKQHGGSIKATATDHSNIFTVQFP